MYVERVPNRSSPPAVLLRHAWREAGKIRKRTLANLSHWPEDRVESLKRVLRGETLVSPHDVFAVESSVPHGHVEAVLGTIRKLGLPSLISSKPSRERDLVVAMIAERLIAPSSKLATTRLWNDSTLAEELSVEDTDVAELYRSLDGCWGASTGSRPSSRRAASRTGPWCSTTPPRATTRGGPARSPVSAMTVTARSYR